MGKESITLSMELAKTHCYEFECFEDSYSLTISTQGCWIKGVHPNISREPDNGKRTRLIFRLFRISTGL